MKVHITKWVELLQSIAYENIFIQNLSVLETSNLKAQ